MRKLILAGSLVLALTVAGIAAADGPILWKQHCPQHYTITTVADGAGVTVLCTRAAESDK